MENGAYDPIRELMELDRWIGWSRRIMTVQLLINPPRRRVWPLVVFPVIGAVGLIAMGAAVYLLFFY